MATVSELYQDNDFNELLDDAESNSQNDWEIDFVSSIKERYEKYGGRMFLSDPQQTKLENIANDTRPTFKK